MTRFPRHLVAPVLAAMLAACGGGGDFTEQFVALVRAQFAPSAVTVPAGGSTVVPLELSCDREALDHPDGRLGLRIRLDPEQRLPFGISAILLGTYPPDGHGFSYLPCATQSSDPDVLTARVDVHVSAAFGTPAGASRLTAYVEVESGEFLEPGKDSTLADLDIAVAPGSATPYGANLLINAGFEGAVALGTLPVAAGGWRGDLAAAVGESGDVKPLTGLGMLQFLATGEVPSAALLSSQQWQIVDVSSLAADIAAGRVRADASAWFNRVAGTATTDRRFDLRVLAFDGTAADVPARYTGGMQLGVAAASVATTGTQWEQASAGFLLPRGTTILLVEIYAYEDVVNDATSSEFDGHYADDVSLVLTRLPPP